MINGAITRICAVLCIVAASSSATQAFLSQGSSPCRENQGQPTLPRQPVSVAMGNNNIFDGFKRLFDFGNDDDSKNSDKSSQSSSQNVGRFGGKLSPGNEMEDDDMPAGEYRIATIPVTAIKPGGLRLYLMFYLLGMQNTPEPKSWRADQPSTEEYVVDFWFHDQSAVLSVTLEESQIVVSRVGPKPSTAYLMQESVVMQGILDELQVMVSDESVAPENRLLTLKSPNAIEEARAVLAFG